jgi:hypothetical protein
LRRGATIAVIAVIANLVVIPLGSSVALASSCSSYQEYHYAWQWTATTAAFYHYPSSVLTNAYYGWVGIDGNIQFPNHVPTLGSSGDCAHSIGSIGVYFNDPPGTYGHSVIDTGWYTGCFILNNPPTCRYITLGAYDEVYNAATGSYQAPDISYEAPSTVITFKIEYNSSSGCFNSYWQYNVYTNTICRYSSGVMFAGSEAHTHVSGTIVEMPVTYYGSSTIGGNNELRIKGANGWVTWTTSLSSYTTSRYDESTGAPGCGNTCTVYYYLAEVHSYYYFEAYGENTG